MEPIIRQIKKHGNTRWEVDFGLDEFGNRRRPILETKEKAQAELDAWRKELKRSGAYWANLEPTKRSSIVATLREMDERGVTVGQVWHEWQENEKRGQTKLIETPYKEVVVEWKDVKRAAGKTERYTYHAGEDMLKFAKGREQRLFHLFTGEELEKYINGHKDWSLSTKKTVISLFSSLWEVGVRKNYAYFNITEKLEPITRPGRVVRIWPNDNAQNLMAAIADNELCHPVMSSTALGAFGCMRPDEIQSQRARDEGLPPEKYFTWNDIDLDNGLCTVRVEIAKKGDQRVIRLQPMCVEWLKWGKKLGNAFPVENELKLVNIACEMIDLEDWERDILRKCCITHLREIYRNDYDVVKDCGNSIRTMLKHYADLHVPPAQSKAYWQIGPGDIKEYIKSDKWKAFVKERAISRAARLEQLASENAKLAC